METARNDRRPGPRTLVAAGVLTLVLCSSAFAGLLRTTGAAATRTVTVKTRDGGFTLSARTASVGTVRFVVRNVGKHMHNFKIAGKKTPVLRPGKRATLVVRFRRAGRYAYVSTVGSDARHGLKGTFRLAAAKTPGNAKAGRTVFEANCGTCHTLEAAGTSGTIGPNLTKTKVAYATIAATVRKGKTGRLGTMPPFGSTLTARQIDDVAAFVYASTH
jgi:cytochrome c553